MVKWQMTWLKDTYDSQHNLGHKVMNTVCKYSKQGYKTWLSEKTAGHRSTILVISGLSVTTSFLRRAKVTSISSLIRDPFGFVFVISLTRSWRADSRLWSSNPSGYWGRKCISPFLGFLMSLFGGSPFVEYLPRLPLLTVTSRRPSLHILAL